MNKKFTPFLIVLAFVLSSITSAAQEATSSAIAASEQKQEEQAEREKKAFILLEQIVNDAQLLRLPENRVNVQIDIADLLWDSNQTRARTLFATAGDGVAEIMRT